MDTISQNASITITSAYKILERFKDKYNIGHEPLIPTNTYYPNNKTSYKKFKACMDMIKWYNDISLNYVARNHCS